MRSITTLYNWDEYFSDHYLRHRQSPQSAREGLFAKSVASYRDQIEALAKLVSSAPATGTST